MKIGNENFKKSRLLNQKRIKDDWVVNLLYPDNRPIHAPG